MPEPVPEPVEVIRAAVLSGADGGADTGRGRGVAHGFLGARGGVSTGLVAGLNMGLGGGDEPGAVAENRARAVRAVMPDARLVMVRQVHSADCVVAGVWADDARPEADALVSDQPGVLLGILTADCAPVLLADAEANGGRGVVGAAHAGWKGALAGVTDNTVAAMVALGAEASRIRAAVGPCIQQASYEVDAGFFDRFCGAAPANARFFVAGAAGHWQFDLSAYVAARLRGAGVGQVEVLGLDTYAEAGRFYSFRRATHRAEPAYGRQIALIGL